jgi:hypothetical protein
VGKKCHAKTMMSDMCTPAWVAAKLNYALLLEALLAHADAKMNQPDKLKQGKRTPLYIAACENNLDELLVLIKVGRLFQSRPYSHFFHYALPIDLN